MINMRERIQIGLVAAICGGLAFAQKTPSTQPGGRDLKIETLGTNAPDRAAKPAGVTIPRSYALIIGIGRYQNIPADRQLQFSERDADSIYWILINPEGGNFRAENVHRLIGAKATLSNIRQELENWLPSVAQDGDRVLIYFAGHGFLAQGKAYLAPYDIDLKNITTSGYPMETLGSVIGGKIRAKSKILLTDACHSGAIRPEDTQNFNHRVIDLDKSLFSLTASRDREQSFESPDWGGGHGIFTYYVVKGLEGEADENRNGIVTADELQDYVYRNVREATQGRQNPTSAQGSFDPNMLLAYIPTNAKPGGPAAAKNGTLIFESNMDGVEVFLDGKSQGVLNKGKPLTLPGLTPGVHTVMGVKRGYEPDGPREEMVYPGQDSTVTIKIMIARQRNRAAVDHLDKGLELYNKGYQQNYQKAVEEFLKALDADPTYSLAALYLGRTYNALFDNEQAQKYFRKAIEIDPDYLEARAAFGSMLLDIGNVDEAIRQFSAVLQRDPKYIMALTNLAEAYRFKDLYAQSIESARKAIQLAPKLAEPHLWLAESLRQSGKYPESKAEYDRYLALSNFDSKTAGQLNYYVVGFLFGAGKKRRATQQDIWQDLRSLAYLGMCDCERKLSNFDVAIEHCQKSLAYHKDDPYGHYTLALALMQKAVNTGDRGLLSAALRHFQTMVELNPDLTEVQYANKNIAAIQRELQNH